MMIQKYLDAMMQGDYKALSECFTDRCHYFDYTLSTWNMHNYHVYGSKCIEMFFRHKFTFGIVKCSDPVIENENTANYFVSYAGHYLFVRATIEEYGEDGKIHNMRVRLG